MQKIPKKHMSSARIIILGFAAVILLGAFVLMLPVSSRSRQLTGFADALFTSVSAVCVTGLVVFDTATYWSNFGQAVILFLIQIGGLGVVTVAVALTAFSGRKIGLMQRSTMQEAISAPKVGGIVRLTRFILKSTFIIEVAGALIMMPVFIRDFGLRGIWMAFFHSVSAFCNAGFDLMGSRGEFSSLTLYSENPVITITIMLLITVGGIGFLVWEDIKTNKLKIRKYRMQTKVVLSVSLLLVVLPAVYFYIAEYGQLPFKDRLIAALFQSVSPRTAGFNTTDLTLMSPVGTSIMIILMLIGGSPGSTAGGMKTTTAAVLLFSAASVFGRKKDIECFGRRVPETTIKNASAIFLMYIVLLLFGSLAICTLEGLPLTDCMFETASAIATVGLTRGVTTTLCGASKIILMLLMFFGRVGGLTLIFAALSPLNTNLSRKPQENITVG